MYGFFGGWNNFTSSTNWRGFTMENKGSLEERIMQGRVCGCVHLLREGSEKSLKEYIELAIPILDDLKKNESFPLAMAMPTLSLGNLQNVIWPKFKDVAWLWSAFTFGDAPNDFERIDLTSMDIYDYPLEGVDRGGWWGFIDAAIKIYEMARGNEQRAGKPAPPDGAIWKFSFQLSEHSFTVRTPYDDSNIRPSPKF